MKKEQEKERVEGGLRNAARNRDSISTMPCLPCRVWGPIRSFDDYLRYPMFSSTPLIHYYFRKKKREFSKSNFIGLLFHFTLKKDMVVISLNYEKKLDYMEIILFYMKMRLYYEIVILNRYFKLKSVIL